MLPIRFQIIIGKRYEIRFKVINLESKDEEFKGHYGFIGKLYFAKTGRILGCQSKNHTLCTGELWTCERCGRRVCWEEGSADLPVTYPPKTGPKPVLGLELSGGRKNGKTEGIFSRTDHHETARSRSVARTYPIRGTGDKSVKEACRVLEISEQTYYRWRKEYGGLNTTQAKKLKELEKENARLKHLVADLSLDNATLKEVLSKK